MAVSDTLIGTVFDGRYRIIRKLGAGGMADVYLAEDQELGRRVAIKILNDRHANDDQFVERFRREAKNAAGLSHPNIVSIYDRGEAEGTYYIAMEYLDGRSLKELVVARGPGHKRDLRIVRPYIRDFKPVLIAVDGGADALLEAGRSSCVQSERVRYYHRIQEILAEDLPMIFLYNRDALPVVAARIHGVSPSPSGILYNFNEWYVPKAQQRYTSG